MLSKTVRSSSNSSFSCGVSSGSAWCWSRYLSDSEGFRVNRSRSTMQRRTLLTEILFQCRGRVRIAGFGPVVVLSGEQRVSDTLDGIGDCERVVVVVRCARIVLGIIFVDVTIRARGLLQRRVIGGQNATGCDHDGLRGDIRLRRVVLDPADCQRRTRRMGMRQSCGRDEAETHRSIFP